MRDIDEHDLVAQAQVRNRRARANREAGHPAIGIFWLLPDRLITSLTEVDDAQEYGEMRISRVDHYPHWKSMQRTARTLGRCLPYISDFEYEFWPRGRVSYDVNRKKFLLLADIKILRNIAALNEVLATYCLPLQQTEIRSDTHYFTPVRTTGETGLLE